MNNQFPPPDDETRHHQDPIPRRPTSERVPQPMVRAPGSGNQFPPPAAPEDVDSSGLYVPWWALVLVILVVAGITCGLWGVVLISRGEGSTDTGPTPTPIVVIITATATLEAASPITQPPGGGGTFPAPITPTVGGQAPTDSPTIGPSIPIVLGSTIMISGTGGDGLSVRQGPGVDYAYLFVAKDGDQFLVQDGPREANGYTWWYIVDPKDPNRFGWAVETFMRVIQ
jgi:hypothetical protein